MLGWFHIDGRSAVAWPAAGDRADVIAFHDRSGELAAWMVRVPDATPVRWTDDPGLRVVAATWPEVDLGFATTAAGAPLLCVQGPDLSAARGFVGLDADGRLTALVVIS